jgi:hypothetical protein
MRIITVNLPVSYLKMIDKLTGEDGLYPSRSELIRVAVRDFLIRELEAGKSFTTYQSNLKPPAPQCPLPEPIDNNLFVRVPYGNDSEGEPEYRTFRLVKK